MLNQIFRDAGARSVPDGQAVPDKVKKGDRFTSERGGSSASVIAVFAIFLILVTGVSFFTGNI